MIKKLRIVILLQIERILSYRITTAKIMILLIL